MDETLLKSKIYYYSREKLFHSMIQACEEGLNKFKGNLAFGFYRAIALILCNRFHESVPKLQALQEEENYHLASLLALVQIYEVGELKDSDIFPQMYSQIEDFKTTANALDLMESAYVCFLFENYQSAHEYITTSVKLDRNNFNLSLKGWIELELFEGNPRDCFESSFVLDPNLDTILGLSETFCQVKMFDEALDILNKACSQFPDEHFPMVGKLKVFFASKHWDLFDDSYSSLFFQDDSKIHPEGLKFQIVKLICINGNFKEASRYIDVLMKYLEKYELKNSKFYFECASLFSKIADGDAEILKRTYTFAEISVQISPNNYQYLSQLGFQCFLQQKFTEAIHYYKLAVKINESSISSLIEMSLCELNLNGKSKQLANQIEFLWEINKDSALLKYLFAKMETDTEKSRKLLRAAVEKQIANSEKYSFSLKYINVLHPYLLLMFMSELANLQEDTGLESLTVPDADLRFLIEVTDKVVQSCPGIFTGIFLLAKLNYIAGNFSNSQSLLNNAISDLEIFSSNTFLLLAQTNIKQGRHDLALNNLELGLSIDFTIRGNALYHYLLGLVLKEHGKFEDAIISLNAALKISKTNSNKSTYLTSLRIVSIYKELLQVYKITNQQEKAAELIEEANNEFKGSYYESSVILMSADFAFSNKDHYKATKMLKKIEQSDPCYLQSRVKLASIILEKRRDKDAYLNCYKELTKTLNTAESYILLGDAYLNISMPEEAIDAYKKAIAMNPSDQGSVSKLGKALILTHRYREACEFYKKCMKTTNDNSMRIQLAELYVLLKEFDTGEEFILSELKNVETQNGDDLVFLTCKTSLLKILADIYIQKNQFDLGMKTLKSAVENKDKVKNIYSIQRADIPEEVTELFIELYLKISEIYSLKQEYEQAIMFQMDALVLKRDNQQVLEKLAKNYVQIDEIERCHEVCNALLKLDPDNETALILHADISFQKADFEEAFINFSSLVNKDPFNWRAMARLIETLRRLGNIDQASTYLELAEEGLDDPDKNSGLRYWYLGNFSAALRNFNNAREDPTWSKISLYNMIEICLIPDNDSVTDNTSTENMEYSDSRNMALKTAEKLLQELTQQSSKDSDYKIKCRLLFNFLLLARREKVYVEKALEEFVSMATEEVFKENCGVVLGLATCYIFLKQSQRAKTQLKRIVKNKWTFDPAEYLEKCWLLLADCYMQSSKYDLASELLKKILVYNQSCVKAHENLGYIAEKEQNYKDAIVPYANAWKLGNKSNSIIGYKLAFCCMKCKKYADAIDTAQSLLSLYPDYPKIKKEILEKSMNNLRT